MDTSVKLISTEQTCWRFCCARSDGLIVLYYFSLSPSALQLSLLQVTGTTIGFPSFAWRLTKFNSARRRLYLLPKCNMFPASLFNNTCQFAFTVLPSYFVLLCQPAVLCPAIKISTKTNLNFRHRASCILGQAFHYTPENAFYMFNQQIYFIIWYLLDRASLI